MWESKKTSEQSKSFELKTRIKKGFCLCAQWLVVVGECDSYVTWKFQSGCGVEFVFDLKTVYLSVELQNL